MSTAVIVSGVFRHFAPAYNSWRFQGDYHLITQRRTQTARSARLLEDITQQVEQHQSKFSSIAYVDPKDSVLATTVNMAAKWRAAYTLLEPYNYSKYIVVRPDLYTFHHNWDLINSIDVKPNTMYNISDIVPDGNGDPFVNDMLFIADAATWQTISRFYDYYVDLSTTKNIHIHLSEYLQLNHIQVDSQVLAQGIYIPIRDNMQHLFENDMLTDKYSVNDILTKASEWQKKQQES